MKKLHIVTCQPNDLRFYWETFVQLNNARELGIADKFRILVFIAPDRESLGVGEEWNSLTLIFPEVKFYFYYDRAGVMGDIGVTDYIPLLRCYLLARHFRECPELKQDAIFYIDGDVLFPKSIEWLDKYIQDDVNYMSDTKSYLNSDYFDSKVKDVLPEKLEEYKKIDVLSSLSKAFGISREICEENKNATGGAQSLLKNVDYKFWQDVYSGSMFIRNYLRAINAEYFASENSGFQSWAADMWSLLFNLWRRGMKTSTPTDFNFSWATDAIERVSETNIFHNAGITDSKKLRGSKPGNREDRKEQECPAFFKSLKGYVNNEYTPFEDMSYLMSVMEDEISRTFGTAYYTSEILKTKKNFNL